MNTQNNIKINTTRKPPSKDEFCTCKSKLTFIGYLPSYGMGWVPYYQCPKCKNDGLKMKGQIFMRIKTDN
jgi:hypothetical protein